MNDAIMLNGREVFANRYSITQRERYEAGALGLDPDYRFDVRMYEYQDEDTLIYNGVRYAIYRTYHKGDNVELYVTRKAGVY